MSDDKKTDTGKVQRKVEGKEGKRGVKIWRVAKPKYYSGMLGHGVAFNVMLSPDDIKFREMIAQCLERVEAIRQKIQKDDKEIDRLKAETRRIIAKLQAA